LGPRTRGLSTYEKEYLAIQIAVGQWRAYLQLAEFVIFTDQKSLIHLSDQRLHTHSQQKVFTKLHGLQYKILYKKGTDNRVADALSRHPDPPEQLMALSAVQPVWLDRVKDSYTANDYCQKVISSLTAYSNPVPHFTLLDGLLSYKHRIWVGNDVALQHQNLSAIHGSTFGGHSGFPKTYRKLKQLVAWQGMKAAAHAYAQSCEICQQTKDNRSKYPRLLEPLPVPSGAWEVVTMDFIEGLPKSGQANCIFVVVDKFSKYSHFIPLLHPFLAATVAQAFLSKVYKLHGMPAAIISDRDKVFTSRFWQELLKLAQVTLQMSSSYHPQTDGQSERVNQCLETYLCCFVHVCPKAMDQVVGPS
jgi:hypothetical protein